MFQKGVPARKFKHTKVDQYQQAEGVPFTPMDEKKLTADHVEYA